MVNLDILSALCYGRDGCLSYFDAERGGRAGSVIVDAKVPDLCISVDLMCSAISSKKTPMNIMQIILVKAI